MSAPGEAGSSEEASVSVDDVVVRSVTVFLPTAVCAEAASLHVAIEGAAARGHALRDALRARGVAVQTVRLSAPGPRAFGSVSAALDAARALDAAQVDYASLGVVRPTDGPAFVSRRFLRDVVAATHSVSLCISLTSGSSISSVGDGDGTGDVETEMGERREEEEEEETNDSISLHAVREAAAAVSAISRLDEQGFSNLRFAAVANVRPNGPFFPASYASIPLRSPSRSSSGAVDGTHTRMRFRAALGIQGATLVQRVVASCASCNGIDDVYARLTRAIEAAGELLVGACAEAIDGKGDEVGLDFSTAPLPHPAHSVGAALLSCASAPDDSVEFPSVGGIAAASRLAAAIRAARFPRAGFCGVMLPVCEDVVLARLAPRLNDLLLCSAVCGTGLDVS